MSLDGPCERRARAEANRRGWASSYEMAKCRLKDAASAAEVVWPAAGHLQDCAEVYLDAAVKAFAMDDGRLGCRYTEVARQAAVQAIAQHSHPGLEPAGGPRSPAYIARHTAHGRAMCLATQRVALWLQTGDPRLALLREAAASLAAAEGNKRSSLWRLLRLRWLVEAEEFRAAMDYYRAVYRAALQAPTTRQYVRSKPFSLFALAQWAAGEGSAREVALAGVEYWAGLACDFRYFDMEFGNVDRLGWLYLRGRHVTGVTEPLALIRELRGF